MKETGAKWQDPVNSERKIWNFGNVTELAPGEFNIVGSSGKYCILKISGKSDIDVPDGRVIGTVQWWEEGENEYIHHYKDDWTHSRDITADTDFTFYYQFTTDENVPKNKVFVGLSGWYQYYLPSEPIISNFTATLYIFNDIDEARAKFVGDFEQTDWVWMNQSNP